MDQRIPGADTPIGTTRASEIGNESGRSTVDQVKDKARQAGSKAADRLESAVGQQKQRATGELGAIADALRQAGNNLDSGNNMSGRFISAAADRIDDLSTRLDNRDMTEMVGEVRRWARRNPGAFVGAAVAVGFIASRFLKASEEDRYDGFGGYDDFESEDIGMRNYGAGATGGVGTRSGYGAGSTGGTDYPTAGGAGNLGGTSGAGGFGNTSGNYGTGSGPGSTTGGTGTTGGTTGGLSGAGGTGAGSRGTTGTGNAGTGSTGSDDDGGRYGRS